MQIDRDEFEELAARGMSLLEIFRHLGIKASDGNTEFNTRQELYDAFQAGQKRYKENQAAHQRALGAKSFETEIVPAFSKPVEINRQILNGQIEDPMMIAQALGAYGVPTEVIEALIGHAVDDDMVDQIARAIETGRLQGRAFVASQLFEQIKQGKLPAIQFYLRTKGGPTWSEFGPAPKDGGDSKERMLEALGFSKEQIAQIRGIAGRNTTAEPPVIVINE